MEHAGPWGRKAVAESRLPDRVREFLGGLDDVRVQLIRRHGGESGPGVRVFVARLGGRPRVWTTVLDDVAELCDLRVDDPAADPRFTSYDGPLWLVCTNGRRDLCCAEAGRPIAAALSERWPEATWETTHLGGHRFAGTLLALPDGVALGRLDAGSAVDACAALEAGRLPAGRSAAGPACRVRPGRGAARPRRARARPPRRRPRRSLDDGTVVGDRRRRDPPAHGHRVTRRAPAAELCRPEDQARLGVRRGVVGTPLDVTGPRDSSLSAAGRAAD